MYFSRLFARLTFRIIRAVTRKESEMPESEHFGGTDAWAAIVPNLIGAVFGCAAARMFSVSISYYPVFAIIFAFIIGVAKHCVFDNARLIDALAENLIIMLIFGIVCFIAGLFVN